MKKLLLILVLVLVSVSGFAAELTADTPAVDMTMAEKVWATLTAAFIFVMGMAGRMFSKYADVIIPKIVETLSALLKGIMHFRGSSVVIDTGMQVISEVGHGLAKDLQDGKLTEDERRELVDLIKTKSVEKLKGMFGFYKKDLEAWAQEQAGVFVGKLLYRNSSGSGSKILS